MSESNATTGSSGPDIVATEELSVAEYRLGRRVGADIFGDIYVSTRNGANAVVTLLHDRIVIDRIAADRFAEETARVSDLASWGVIPTLDFDFDSRPRWIASASASGQLLRQRVEASGSLQPAATRLLASKLARALQALHARGVTQRDLSPDSVLLGAGSAALWHSGWAGLLDGSDYAGTSHTEHVEWLAPEQFTGDGTGPESDIHAWAVTLLYAATGYNPFAAEKASLSVSRLMRETPLIPAVFDPVLASLVAGGLSKDPAARPTARDLVAFLDPGAPLLEPASASPIPVSEDPKDVVADESDTGHLPASPVDLEKRPRKTPAVDLTKRPAVALDVPVADDLDEDTGLAVVEDPDGGGDEDHVSAASGRRIGIAALAGLSVVVITLGSAVGIAIGKALGE